MKSLSNIYIENDDDEMQFPPIPVIINHQYSFIKSAQYKLAAGFCHATYYGTDINTKQHIAIKQNLYNNRHQDVYLKWQYQKYRMMKGGAGIPNILWYGQIDRYNTVIMHLFDANLQQLFTFCNYKFSLKTILMIAKKLVLTIEHIHTSKNIYCNVNPVHFVVKYSDIYFVGFGNVKYYINPRNQKHIGFHDGMRKKNVSRYASINEHLGFEMSRRDDLESIGYVLLYFLYKGKLPWSGLKRKRDEDKDVIGTKKMEISIECLCKEYPKEFELYLKYCRSLKFEEKPNYEYLRKLFNDLYLRNNYNKEEFVWDWDIRKLVLIHGYCRVMIENKLILPIDMMQLVSAYIIPVFLISHQSNSGNKKKYDIV